MQKWWSFVLFRAMWPLVFIYLLYLLIELFFYIIACSNKMKKKTNPNGKQHGKKRPLIYVLMQNETLFTKRKIQYETYYFFIIYMFFVFLFNFLSYVLLLSLLFLLIYNVVYLSRILFKYMV